MEAEIMELRLRGVRPLIMHSSRLADPLDPVAVEMARLTSKRPKTGADHAEIGRLEWHGGLWLHQQRPALPAEALEACFLAAAKTRRRGKQAAAGLMIEAPALIEYDGPAAIADLWQDSRFQLRHLVRVNDSRTMRTRPRFPEWSARVVATFLPSLLDAREIKDIWEIAGFRIGIGDWRPRFGRFNVE